MDKKSIFLIAFNVLLVAALGYLYYLHFSSAKKNNSSKSSNATEQPTRQQGLIAYVDLDSLEANYILFKEKKAELEKRQRNIENTLSQKAAAFEKELYALQEKAPMMTRSETEEAQKKMYQKQMELEDMRERMAKQFLEEQQAFNRELQSRLDSFLLQYNADKRYSFIFSHIKGGPLLYCDEAYNITADVIKGMNEALKASGKK
ncbi:MAG: OmpH family outer membrane protein [Chitinophagales bacterium]|nr:OmpH family outer membrane protein [Chitinophagales bacterium]MDW8274114.1 OmpH family outer membrane protein [Chitinophagales bacterium]